MTGDHYSQSVKALYGRDQLSASILAALHAIGKEPGNVTLKDLAPLDHYHFGGYRTSIELANRASIQPGQRVLDIGGGIGGPARTMAAEFGCTVTVLDLTEEFCRAGELLTMWTNLGHQVIFRQGNALALPFADSSFDVVWAEYSFMNIAEKESLYSGIYRVLRPGGRFAFQEIMAGPVQPLHFPVPWADSPSISFLRPPAEIRALLQRVGFVEVDWTDYTPAAVEAIRMRSAATSKRDTAEPTLPNLASILRPPHEVEHVAQNVARNSAEGRFAYIQAVFDKT